MTNKRISGIAYLRIDGRLFETKGEFTINPGQPMREGQVGTNRVVGFSEKPQVPSIEGKAVLTAELSPLDFTSITDATIQVLGPNGGTHVLREAWFAGDGSYGTDAGEIALKFEGAAYEYVPAA